MCTKDANSISLEMMVLLLVGRQMMVLLLVGRIRQYYYFEDDFVFFVCDVRNVRMYEWNAFYLGNFQSATIEKYWSVT